MVSVFVKEGEVVLEVDGIKGISEVSYEGLTEILAVFGKYL